MEESEEKDILDLVGGDVDGNGFCHRVYRRTGSAVGFG